MNGVLTKYKSPNITQEEEIKKSTAIENAVKSYLKKIFQM